MPTRVHEFFVHKVEDEIHSQLKAICSGSGRWAQFAQKVQEAGSTFIYLATSDSSSKSKYEPDASFWHDDAQYPGVIIEVAYSQKKKRLGRLAENYLLDSDASVRAVVGLDIEYGKQGSQKATLSIWRPRLFNTADGPELRAVEEFADEVNYILMNTTRFGYSDSPARLSVTMKETLSTIQAYDSSSAISPVKNLYSAKWEMKIQKFASPQYSSANTLLRRRIKHGKRNH